MEGDERRRRGMAPVCLPAGLITLLCQTRHWSAHQRTDVVFAEQPQIIESVRTCSELPSKGSMRQWTWDSWSQIFGDASKEGPPGPSRRRGQGPPPGRPAVS